MPADITSSPIRAQVSELNTGFFDGRQFRMFVDLNIPKGGTVWVRHTIGANFILYDQRLSMLSGEVRWSALAATSSSPGPWTPATFRRRNQMTSQPQPLYISTSTMETSSAPDAATGGIEVDVMRASGSANIIQNAGPRGLAPGVYHAKITNVGKEAAVGVYDWWWEERP